MPTANRLGSDHAHSDHSSEAHAVLHAYRQSLRIYGDGAAEVIGVNHETRNIRVVARNSEAIALKVAGRSVWGGNGEPRPYVGAEILVFRVVNDTDGKFPQVIDVEPLIKWGARAAVRAAKGE